MTDIFSEPASAMAGLVERMRRARQSGSDAALARQRERGKLTARERIDCLLDDGSFVELDALTGERNGVVTGFGTVDERSIVVFAQDFTVAAGAVGEAGGAKICKALDFAAGRCPVVGIYDGAGGRIQDGVVAQAMYGEIFHRTVQLSGSVPQIALIMGPCAGGAAYAPALTDFVVMVDGMSNLLLTGPRVLQAATGERVDVEDLGGARTHATRSGNAHHLAHDEHDAIDFARQLLAYLPSTSAEAPPVAPSLTAHGDDDELDRILPVSARRPYDMLEVIRRIVDDGALLPLHSLFAPSIVCGFARIAGRTVGIVANQPLHAAGCLDIDASEKAARFVRTCDAFNVPIVTLVDVPGFKPGVDQEHQGIVRRGAKLLYAYAEATVPKVTVIVRKAYGGGYVVMGSKHLGADLALAWPTAEIAVMGAAGAVSVLHRRELSEATDAAALRAQLTSEYHATHGNPYRAAERGYVDAVIAPSATRRMVSAGLALVGAKRETTPRSGRGNMPV